MAVLKFKDIMGAWHSIPAIQGASVYEQAVKGGYTGTLEQFEEKLATDYNQTYVSYNQLALIFKQDPLHPGLYLYDPTERPNESIPPSTPTNLTATATSHSSVLLEWTESTDNVAVEGYEYRVDGGTEVDAGSGTSVLVTGLTELTEYDFEVRAYDTSGNRSGWSSVATETTLEYEGIACEAVGTQSSLADLTTYTFTGVSLGDASASRQIIVVAGGKAGSNRTVSSITVGGQACAIDHSISAMTTVAIGRVVLPAGATGDVVVTFSDTMVRAGVQLFRVTGPRLAVSDTETCISFYENKVDVLGTLNGLVIVGQYGGTLATAVAWTGATGAPGSYVNEVDSNHFVTGAHSTSVGVMSIYSDLIKTMTKTIAVIYEEAV